MAAMKTFIWWYLRFPLFSQYISTLFPNTESFMDFLECSDQLNGHRKGQQFDVKLPKTIALLVFNVSHIN